LDHVLKNLHDEFPNVNCVHFFSDGPTTQYRQKKNFHLFSTKLFTYRLCSETSIKLYYVSEEAVNALIETVPPSLPALPGTMSVHQLYVHNSKPASVMFRDISCFCSVTHDLCNCFEAKTFDFPLPLDTVNLVPCSDDSAGVVMLAGQLNLDENRELRPSLTLSSAVGESAMQPCVSEINSTLTPIDSTNAADVIGKYCVVRYDNKPYPGRILDIDEGDVTVECMHCIGGKADRNRFYWPDKVKDICSYTFNNVLSIIPEPQRISDHGRAYNHYKIMPEIWKQIEQMFR